MDQFTHNRSAAADPPLVASSRINAAGVALIVISMLPGLGARLPATHLALIALTVVAIAMTFALHDSIVAARARGRRAAKAEAEVEALARDLTSTIGDHVEKGLSSQRIPWDRRGSRTVGDSDPRFAPRDDESAAA